MSTVDKPAEKTSAMKMLVTVGQYNSLTLLFISCYVRPYLWLNEMTEKYVQGQLQPLIL